MNKKLLVSIGLIFLILPLAGCLQKGVQRDMIMRTFTFTETDPEVVKTGIDVEWAQIYGNFNSNDDSVTAWQYYNFNDQGIAPDEVANDGKWTCRVNVLEGKTLYLFKIGGTKDGDSDDDEIFDPNNPEKYEDIEEDEWSVLYIQ
jgi:hypothetical protein